VDERVVMVCAANCNKGGDSPNKWVIMCEPV